jgi:hypothetical protein
MATWLRQNHSNQLIYKGYMLIAGMPLAMTIGILLVLFSATGALGTAFGGDMGRWWCTPPVVCDEDHTRGSRFSGDGLSRQGHIAAEAAPTQDGCSRM